VWLAWQITCRSTWTNSRQALAHLWSAGHLYVRPHGTALFSRFRRYSWRGSLRAMPRLRQNLLSIAARSCACGAFHYGRWRRRSDVRRRRSAFSCQRSQVREFLSSYRVSAMAGARCRCRWWSCRLGLHPSLAGERGACVLTGPSTRTHKCVRSLRSHLVCAPVKSDVRPHDEHRPYG
jgi:hypothetical protein